MKLMCCVKCRSLVSLGNDKLTYCECGECVGGYHTNGITGIVNRLAVVVGIDNNSFINAMNAFVEKLDYPTRLDFFFCGWIPTKPGEVIVLDSVEEVKTKYKEISCSDEHKHTEATMPISEGE